MRHGDPNVLCGAGPCPLRRQGKGRCGPCDGEERVDVHAALHRFADAVQLRGVVRLRLRHEAQMALRQGEGLVAHHGPQQGDADALQRLRDRVPVRGRPQAVQDDTAEVHRPVVLPKPQRHGRGALAHGARVNDQHDGQAQELRDLRAAADAAATAVVEAHHTLCHGHVRPTGGAGEEALHDRGRRQPRVEAQDLAVPRRAMKSGVDVVRPDLVPHDAQAPAVQRRQEAADDRRLAGPARRRGHQQAGLSRRHARPPRRSAERTRCATNSGNPSPAARAALGTRLVAVMPGAVLTSRIQGVPSSERRKSARL